MELKVIYKESPVLCALLYNYTGRQRRYGLTEKPQVYVATWLWAAH